MRSVNVIIHSSTRTLFLIDVRRQRANISISMPYSSKTHHQYTLLLTKLTHRKKNRKLISAVTVHRRLNNRRDCFDWFTICALVEFAKLTHNTRSPVSYDIVECKATKTLNNCIIDAIVYWPLMVIYELCVTFCPNVVSRKFSYRLDIGQPLAANVPTQKSTRHTKDISRDSIDHILKQIWFVQSHEQRKHHVKYSASYIFIVVRIIWAASHWCHAN